MEALAPLIRSPTGRPLRAASRCSMTKSTRAWGRFGVAVHVLRSDGQALGQLRVGLAEGTLHADQDDGGDCDSDGDDDDEGEGENEHVHLLLDLVGARTLCQ